MSAQQEELYDEEEEEEEEVMEEEDQEFRNSLEEAQAQDNTMMSISWATERQEISKYGPQVKSGVVNASTSAKHADGIPFEVFPQDAGLSEFFLEDPDDDFDLHVCFYLLAPCQARITRPYCLWIWHLWPQMQGPCFR